MTIGAVNGNYAMNRGQMKCGASEDPTARSIQDKIAKAQTSQISTLQEAKEKLESAAQRESAEHIGDTEEKDGQKAEEKEEKEDAVSEY